MNSSLRIKLITPGTYHIRSRSSVRTKWSNEIGNFVKGLAADDADWVERYNGGNSYLGVKFKNEGQHLMFVLKWGHLIKKDMYYDWKTRWRVK